MVEVRQTAVFSKWLNRLRDRDARLRIATRIRRLELGNAGDVKAVGEGVSEMRIPYGPGYRVYFVQDGNAVVVLSAAATSRHRFATLPRPGRWPRNSDMALNTTKFDIQDHLKTPEDRAAYLEAAFGEGEAAFITHALNDVARAIGMTDVARSAGITREGLYKALGEKGDPKLSTLLGVARALGVRLSVSPTVPNDNMAESGPSA